MNKRRDKRAILKKPVLINGNIKVMGLDLSEGGIYIRTSHSFPVGTMLDVEVPIDKGSLKFRARVQHAQEGAGMGLMFIGVPTAERQLLRSYLKKLSENSLLAGNGKKKVLIIEEDAVERRIFKSKLLLDGFAVFESEDGFMGIHILQLEKIDLVLLDLDMKKLDAFKALYLIRNNPVWKKLPVLALALRSTPEAIEKAKKAGVTEVLTAVTPEILSERVLANLEVRL